MKVSGDIAHVSDGVDGLLSINISTATAPTLQSAYNTPGNAQCVDVSGTVAYVADGSGGLRILQTVAPTAVVAYATGMDAQDVQVVGTTAYVADGANGLKIFDVSSLSALAAGPIGSYDTGRLCQQRETSWQCSARRRQQRRPSQHRCLQPRRTDLGFQVQYRGRSAPC